MQRAASKGIEPDRNPTLPAKSRGFRHVKKALLAAAALLAMIGVSVAYWTFDLGATSSVASAPNPHQPNAEPELLPAVGKGQRFSREYVRYCQFQEERLRVVKQQVRGPEDIRAYNALANDYNSRCADFFYQDEDHPACEGRSHRQTKTSRSRRRAHSLNLAMAQGRRRGTSGIIQISQSGIRRVSALIVQRPLQRSYGLLQHGAMVRASGIGGVSRQDQAGFPI